jgi:hypothetical protein
VALKSVAAAENPKINLREIFRVVRFSTFATISGAKLTSRLGASARFVFAPLVAPSAMKRMAYEILP